MDKTKIVGEFIRGQYLARSRTPLVVGVQGPQGSGKSFLSDVLPGFIKSEYNLTSASFSLDDLYHTHETLTDLAQRNRGNQFFQGRGLPGTHDLQLGQTVFKQLIAHGDNIELPVYDKSRYGGQGDRSSETKSVHGTVDVVIFEGWMVGFASKSEDIIKKIYSPASTSITSPQFDQSKSYMAEHPLSHIQQLNTELEEYADKLWSYIDAFVQLRPIDLAFVWEWRLEQELAMKQMNGGQGMSDEQVRKFITRYMPAYELFSDTVTAPGTRWEKHGLTLILDFTRDVVKTELF